MKKSVLFFCFICFTTQIAAQENSLLGVSLGLSRKAGHDSGYGGALSYLYFIKEKISIGIEGGFYSWAKEIDEANLPNCEFKKYSQLSHMYDFVMHAKYYVGDQKFKPYLLLDAMLNYYFEDEFIPYSTGEPPLPWNTIYEKRIFKKMMVSFGFGCGVTYPVSSNILLEGCWRIQMMHEFGELVTFSLGAAYII